MAEFKGFSTPTFTQTPNEFFDIVMSGELSKSEIRILAFMIRYTFGWQRAGFSLQFSFTDIEKEMTMARKQVNEGLKGCLEKGYIERAEIHGSFVYRLKLDTEQELPWDLKFEWKKVTAKREEFEGSFEKKPEVVSKGNQEQFRKETSASFEKKPVEEPSAVEPPKSKPRLNTTLNKKDKNNIKNNNKGASKTLSPSSQKDVISNHTLPVVVDLLNKHDLKPNQKTLDKWNTLADEKTVCAAIEDAITNPRVKNVIGYVTRMLEQGYTAPVAGSAPAPKKNKLPEWVERQGQRKVAETPKQELDDEQKRQAEELLRALGEIE